MASYEAITFGQLLKEVEAKEFKVLDVRNRDEIANTGKIPGATNIPLPEVKEAFSLEEAEFKQKYGAEKPAKDDSKVVVHCMAGRRAATALDQLKELGYNQFKWYSGSFSDWQKNNGPIEKN